MREAPKLVARPSGRADTARAPGCAAFRPWSVGCCRLGWILTALGHDPLHATLPEGTDPADLIAQRRPEDLAIALRAVTPLSRLMLEHAATAFA